MFAGVTSFGICGPPPSMMLHLMLQEHTPWHPTVILTGWAPTLPSPRVSSWLILTLPTAPALPTPLCDILSGCCFVMALDSHLFFPSHVGLPSTDVLLVVGDRCARVSLLGGLTGLCSGCPLGTPCAPLQCVVVAVRGPEWSAILPFACCKGS